MVGIFRMDNANSQGMLINVKQEAQMENIAMIVKEKIKLGLS
jgi:hypothetical protein